MTTDESFGRRLRRERERRQIALASISASTKINVAVFEALEREDVSRWPTGIFRRAFIRAYAENIGLDADDVLREFLERFPDPTERLAPVTQSLTTSAPRRRTPLRLTLADADAPLIGSPRGSLGGSPPGNLGRRLAAVACDASIVVAIAAGVFIASGTFWLPLTIVMLSYYAGGVVALGNTPGMSLWARTHRADSRSKWVSVQSVMKATDALMVRFDRAASAPEQRGALRTEPGTSES
jgi:Helix-turn-helix domain